MRGADINYLNKKTGMTHLRLAIEEELPAKIVKWLLKSGANPHILDYDDRDCCDAASGKEIYKNIVALQTGECKLNKELRINPATLIQQTEAKRSLISELMQKVNVSKAQNPLPLRQQTTIGPLLYELLEDDQLNKAGPERAGAVKNNGQNKP